MRREITDVWLRGLRPPKTGRFEVWDARVTNLALRLTPSGTATWSVRAWTKDGKRTRPKIGAWPTVGVQEARRQAVAMTAEIQAGGDPVASKRSALAERAARAELPTVEARLTEWRETKTAGWSERHAKEVERICRREITPVFGKRPLVDTTRADWAALVARKRGSAPAMASLIYRVCSSFLGHAEAHGWVETSLLPRKGLAVIAPPAASRERVLSDEELRAIWLAADKAKPKPRVFVRLLVMTACREIEAADIATGELALDAARWTIPGPRTKNGQPITLPLHPLLVADLQQVWPPHGDKAGSGWRLLGAIAGSGLRGFSKLKAGIDKASGVAGWRWHDLRRTARTGMTRLGVSRDHAEAALNHISGRSKLERTYNVHDYGPEIIAALQRWQAHVVALVTTPPSAEVLPLRRRA
jgi:integrase